MNKKHLSLLLLLVSLSLWAKKIPPCAASLDTNPEQAALATIQGSDFNFELVRQIMLDFSAKDEKAALTKECELISLTNKANQPGMTIESIDANIKYMLNLGPENRFGLAVSECLIDGINTKKAYIISLGRDSEPGKALEVADLRYKINIQTRFYIQDNKIYIMSANDRSWICVDVFKLADGKIHE